MKPCLRLVFIIGVLGVSLSLAAPLAAQGTSPTPAPQEINFPELTGPYKVGRVSLEWVDQSRDETFASIPGLKRDLMVNIWFPASPAKRDKVAAYMGGDLMWDIFWHGHPGLESLVHSHAYRTSTLDIDKPNYPVIIFSGGFGDSSLLSAAIIEEIASHGYIVIGVSHPYTDLVISYPDGRLLLGGYVIQASNPSTALLTIWTQNMRFALDQAETLNTTDGPFKGHLDLTRVGVFGHSFGGNASFEATAADPRFVAGANLDGGFHSSADIGSKPFLYIGDYATDRRLALERQDQYWLRIDGAAHCTYVGFGLLVSLIPELNSECSVGSIDPTRALQIVDSYLLVFFDHYLNGSVLNWPTYDEAHLMALE